MRRWMSADPIRGNLLMTYVNQTIMLYVLNLYNDVRWLFLNKNTKKKKRKDGMW